jgi:type VI secretion system protein ImpB
MAPGLSFRVANTLQDDGTELPVSLAFRSMDDFEPANIVSQIPALKELMDKRNEMRDLLTQIDRSDKLEGLLDQILAKPDLQQKVREELDGRKPAKDNPSAPAE